jgi:cytochrome P450
MREVLRLFPSVPFNSRKATMDTTLPTGGGPAGTAPVFVRKGEEVGYSVYIMQRRKDLWGEDAEEFRPERFEGHRHGWEYLPFNGGPRICLGQQFALTEAGYSIVRMMQKYDAIEFVESFDRSAPVKHSLSLTDAPYEVPVRLHEAATTAEA